MVGWPRLVASCPPSCPLTFPQQGRRRKLEEETQINIKATRSLTKCHYVPNTLNLGKINLNYCQLKKMDNWKQRKIKTTSSSTLFSFPGSTSLLHLEFLFLLPQPKRRWIMGAMVSSLQFLCATPSSSHFSTAPALAGLPTGCSTSGWRQAEKVGLI